MVVGVDQEHQRVSRAGTTFTSRDHFVAGTFSSHTNAIAFVKSEDWNCEYVAIEETKLDKTNTRKIVNWYTISDGIAESTKAPAGFENIKNFGA